MVFDMQQNSRMIFFFEKENDAIEETKKRTSRDGKKRGSMTNEGPNV